MPFATYGDFRISMLECNRDEPCPRGPFHLRFTTPVRGERVLRYVHAIPEAKIVIRDTTSESTVWTLEANYKPRTRIRGRGRHGDSRRLRPVAPGQSGQRESHHRRAAARRLRVRPSRRRANRASNAVGAARERRHARRGRSRPCRRRSRPQSSSRFGWSTIRCGMCSWPTAVTEQRIPSRSPLDRAHAYRRASSGAGRAARRLADALRGEGQRQRGRRPTSSHRRPRRDRASHQPRRACAHRRGGRRRVGHWRERRTRARRRHRHAVRRAWQRARHSAPTDARGVARISGWKVRPLPPRTRVASDGSFNDIGEGYVKVTLGDDRAIAIDLRVRRRSLAVAISDIDAAWGDDRLPLAGAVFTERGIYRPGERVYAKAIVRDGRSARCACLSAGDSIKWRFKDREGALLQEATVRAVVVRHVDAIVRAAGDGRASVHYGVDVQVKRQGDWRTVGSANYRVAEYRPPEFLVDRRLRRRRRHFPGDTLRRHRAVALLCSARRWDAPQVGWLARVDDVSSVGSRYPRHRRMVRRRRATIGGTRIRATTDRDSSPAARTRSTRAANARCASRCRALSKGRAAQRHGELGRHRRESPDGARQRVDARASGRVLRRGEAAWR